MGRPRVEVNWDIVDEMCAIDCTGPEICAVLRVSEDTMTRRAKSDHGTTFAEYIAKKRLTGNVSLRRSQWMLAHSGNATMLIWLGKNRLGQTDKIEQDMTHHGDLGPIVLPPNDRDA